jgi:hypothetical protein
MLQMFHLDVLEIDIVVAHVVMAIYICLKCLSVFRFMLQIFHLYVLKVDWVLHAAIHLVYQRVSRAGA